MMTYEKPQYPPESGKNSSNKLDVLSDFNKAIALKPDFDEAKANKVKTLHFLWRFEEAMDVWDSMHEENEKEKVAKYAHQSCLILAYEAYLREEYVDNMEWLNKSAAIHEKHYNKGD